MSSDESTSRNRKIDLTKKAQQNLRLPTIPQVPINHKIRIIKKQCRQTNPLVETEKFDLTKNAQQNLRHLCVSSGRSSSCAELDVCALVHVGVADADFVAPR